MEHMPIDCFVLGHRFIIICKCPAMIVTWVSLIHATPVIRPRAYSILILLFTKITTAVFVTLLLLFHYCYCYKTVTTDKLLRASLFPGAAELTTPLLRLSSILCLPCVESINWVILPSKTVAIPYTCGSSVYLQTKIIAVEKINLGKLQINAVLVACTGKLIATDGNEVACFILLVACNRN